MTRLRPWQRLPAVECELCSLQATRRVSVSDFVTLDTRSEDEGLVKSMTWKELPELGAALACEVHSHDLMDYMTDEHGMATSEPLRSTWRLWMFHQFAPTKWIGAIDVALHNRRMRRGFQRAAACAHDWPAVDGDACLRGCGMHRLRPPA